MDTDHARLVSHTRARSRDLVRDSGGSHDDNMIKSGFVAPALSLLCFLRKVEIENCPICFKINAFNYEDR